MAKGVRSKRIRANKSEFRNTIGQAGADAFMASTQAKLLEAISKGGGGAGAAGSTAGGNAYYASSLARTAAMLGGDCDLEMADGDDDDGDDDGEEGVGEKDPMADVKVGAKDSSRRKKVQAVKSMAGTHGAHKARIQVSKSNKRGQTKHGFKISKKAGNPAKKKRGGEKMA